MDTLKFICDDNLGKLARYLRILGFDTHFDSSIDDAKLIATALKENRVILTRDRKILPKMSSERILLIVDDNPEQQLAQVVQKFAITINSERLFSRCLECNAVCEEIDTESIKERVFPFILRTQKRFHRCPECNRIYWKGSHYWDMLARLERILDTVYG